MSACEDCDAIRKTIVLLEGHITEQDSALIDEVSAHNDTRHTLHRMTKEHSQVIGDAIKLQNRIVALHEENAVLTERIAKLEEVKVPMYVRALRRVAQALVAKATIVMTDVK